MLTLGYPDMLQAVSLLDRSLMSIKVAQASNYPLATGVNYHEVGGVGLTNVTVAHWIYLIRFVAATNGRCRQAEQGALAQRGLRLRS